MVTSGDGKPVDVNVRSARSDEGERLREIAVASKSYWGYDVESVREWVAGAEFSPHDARELEIYVAEANGVAAGWASLVPRRPVAWLEDLWIEPAWIGAGVGTRLFEHAAERARGHGATRLEWESEPNAVGFYEKMGGRYVRDSKVSAWGRIVPVMALELS